MKHQPVGMKISIPDKAMSNRWEGADFRWVSQKLSRVARWVGLLPSGLWSWLAKKNFLGFVDARRQIC